MAKESLKFWEAQTGDAGHDEEIADNVVEALKQYAKSAIVYAPSAGPGIIDVELCSEFGTVATIQVDIEEVIELRLLGKFVERHKTLIEEERPKWAALFEKLAQRLRVAA